MGRSSIYLQKGKVSEYTWAQKQLEKNGPKCEAQARGKECTVEGMLGTLKRRPYEQRQYQPWYD